MNSIQTKPVGRFAPTPSGHLHLGSLSTAVGCYLAAKSQGGTCYLRIDDIDTPRIKTGAIESILRTLKAYHFQFDSEVFYQSQHLVHYQSALEDLIEKKIIYACKCSRKALAENAATAKLGIIYPSICRDKALPLDNNLALRVSVLDKTIELTDLYQGTYKQNLADTSGDFVLKRADGIFSYHLSTVVDDHLQGVNQVVRGLDLLPQTPRHIFLREALGYRTIDYAHLPLVTHDDGQKFSKQSHAPAVNIHNPCPALINAFKHLGMTPPSTLVNQSVVDIWDWALTHFKPFPRQT